jgi:hypothetical protein
MARSFVQLNMDKRRVIARMHQKKISQAEIGFSVVALRKPIVTHSSWMRSIGCPCSAGKAVAGRRGARGALRVW